MIRYAGLIARRGPTGWRGVLIEGPSGAGKSDLALRALNQGYRLVADDRVLLWTSGGRLFGMAGPNLAGLIEVRGLGVLPIEALRFCEVVLAVSPGAPERLPEPRHILLCGVRTPAVELDFFEASAPTKLGLALDTFDLNGKRGM